MLITEEIEGFQIDTTTVRKHLCIERNGEFGMIRLQSFKVLSYRKMLETRWIDRVSNEEVLDRMTVEKRNIMKQRGEVIKGIEKTAERAY